MINKIATAVMEAAHYGAKDAYISDLALSSVWGDAPEDDIPAGRIEVLGKIYDALEGDGIRSVCAAFGLTQAAFACRFGIPLRTVSDWCRDLRTPPPYIVTMAVELLALEQLEKAD